MKVGKALRIVLIIQLLVVSAICLEALGLTVPFFRQIVGFFYLTFVPGILLLRILRIKESDNVRVLLYSVGFSVVFLTFIGLLMNSLYPLVGISKPISILPLIITINVFLIVFSILSDRRRELSPSPEGLNRIYCYFSSKTSLFLFSIPVFSIVGCFVALFFQNSMLLLFMIFVIALVVFLIGFDKFITRKFYPLAIFAIAVSLLYMSTLTSPYLTGWDINVEYHFSNLVTTNSYWNPNLPNQNNAMASLVILSPVYSIILGIGNDWIFKTVFPLFFSLVPLGLYKVYSRYTSEKIAFLSVFFFMSFVVFFTEMTTLAKQQLAELFLVLLLLLITNEEMKPRKTAILSVFFGILLIISHYGLSYIFMFYIALVWLAFVVVKNRIVVSLWERVRGKRSNQPTIGYLVPQQRRIITGVFVLFYVFFAFSWYNLIAGSSTLNTLAGILDQLYKGIFAEFFNPNARDPFVGLAFGATIGTQSLQREMFRIIQFITQFFIAVGVILLIAKRKTIRINFEYLTMIFASAILIVLSITLPYFASSLRMTRLYHIALILISPCCILGGIAFLKAISKPFARSRISRKPETETLVATLLVSILLISYFLFNTGFVYELTRDTPTSPSLSVGRTQESSAVAFSGFYIREGEVFGARWLARYRDNSSEIYSDPESEYRVLVSYGMIPLENSLVLSNNTKISGEAYIYLNSLNVLNGLITTYDPVPKCNSMNEVSPILEGCNKIYSNGGCEIYQSTPHLVIYSFDSLPESKK